MVFITPPPEPNYPDIFRISCFKCGNHHGFIKEVHHGGSVLFACNDCEARELHHPNPKKKGA